MAGDAGARRGRISLTAARVTHWAGRAEALHARPIEVAHRISVLRAVRPAIVLGRAQTVDDGVEARAAHAGFALARRVSGGSAVVVGPGECAWVDVVVARGGAGWNDDIGKAGCWMGDAWVAALDAVGVSGATVHRTAMQRRPGSAAVCFAGVGPGEVLTDDGAKLVGISQRRTRGWALFQCAVPLRWVPGALIEVLGPDAVPAATAPVATLDEATAAAAVAALASHLT